MNNLQTAEAEGNGLAATDEAAITAVAASEAVGVAAGGYTFSVTVERPDTGCSQYANWWEVVTTDGTLLYWRILEHS